MDKPCLEDLFKNLENSFDIETPESRHQTRFLDKLNNQDKTSKKIVRLKTNYWKPLLGIAASIALLVALFFNTSKDNTLRDLANVSPQMAETQDFFTNVISEELSNINKEKSPEVKRLINDALKRMKILENNYENLKLDLTNSGDDKRVIYAMISNFQKRIDLLQNTLQQIKNVKQLKNSPDYETGLTL